MTHMHKFLVAAIAMLTFSAFAQTSTSGTTGTTDTSTSTTSTPQPNTMSSPTTNSSMNNVPSTTPTGTSTSSTTSTTTGTTATRDPAMIREVQQALIDKGISTGGAVDGMWGSRSASALREFQRQQGMAVTGTLDNATLSALGVSSGADGFSPGTTEDDTTTPGMPSRQGRSPSDVIDDTAPMDNTTPGTGRSPSDDQQ